MKKFVILAFVFVSYAASAQQTMKEKLKPLIEKYLKTDPLYHNCVVTDVVITNISILDENEKNKSLFDYYHTYRLQELEQIGFIKGKAEFIEQHCADNKELLNKYVDEINGTLKETVPLIDSLWVLEDKYKMPVRDTTAAEYYLVTFNLVYLLDKSRVEESNHKIIFNQQLEAIHHDYLITQ